MSENPQRLGLTKTRQIASISAIFTSTYHSKQLNSWPNSLANRVVNYSQLSAFQGNTEPFEGDLNIRGHLTGLRNKPQQKQPRKLHQYLFELLVNVYSYHLMVRSVSCCCVHGSQLFSNPVTHTHTHTHAHTHIHTESN